VYFYLPCSYRICLEQSAGVSSGIAMMPSLLVFLCRLGLTAALTILTILRVKYELSMMMRRCLSVTAPQYLTAHCVPVSATASRQHLRSAASHQLIQLVVPSYRLSSYGRRSFSVAGPATWNSLPRHLRDPVHTTVVFGTLLKTFFFSEY